MKKIIALTAYAVSVYVSWKYCGGHWVVGPVFAAALIAVNFEGIKKTFSLKTAALFAASTLIYALVFWIADKGWKLQPEWLDMIAGATTAAVILGSVLMPAVHALLFNLKIKDVQSTTFALIGSWYFSVAFSFLRENTALTLPISEGLLAIALWQGIYLLRLKLK